MLKKIRNFFNIIFYYFLLLLGILGTSWIVWSRFIRERTIREVPDLLLTEYRFWVLLYICCIYLYIIKNLVKPKEEPSIFSEIIAKWVKIIYKPLIILDKYIKYTVMKESYYDFTRSLTSEPIRINSNLKQTFIVLFQILPRGILVIILLIDIFHFQKISIFYYFVILGISPLIFRYLKYSIKEVYEHYVELLDETYSKVRIYEFGYEYDYEGNDIPNTKRSSAEYHNLKVPVKDYIEILSESLWDLTMEEENACSYRGTPYPREHVYKEYEMKKFNSLDNKNFFTMKDYDEMDQLFYDLIDPIIHIKNFWGDLKYCNNEKWVRYIKAFIFALYFVAWSYVLFISYNATQIELSMFKTFILTFLSYIFDYKNPFSPGDYES